MKTALQDLIMILVVLSCVVVAVALPSRGDTAKSIAKILNNKQSVPVRMVAGGQ